MSYEVDTEFCFIKIIIEIHIIISSLTSSQENLRIEIGCSCRSRLPYLAVFYYEVGASTFFNKSIEPIFNYS